MSSSDKINFSLRTNKNVERKLIFESLSDLSNTFDVAGYRYLGLGAIWFVDFLFAHKALAIGKLISFEKKSRTYTRAEFNKPFSCVKVLEGDARSNIPKLDLTKEPILAWLDYDSAWVGSSVGEDVALLAEQVPSGSIILVTVCSRIDQLDGEVPHVSDEAILNEVEVLLSAEFDDESDRVARIKDQLIQRRDIFERRRDAIKMLAGGNAPPVIDKKHLTSKYFPELLATILMAQFRTSLLGPRPQYNFIPIYNFRYHDGAQMITVGGMIANEADTRKLRESGILDRDYIGGEEQVEIDVPPLTLKEKAALDQLLPSEQVLTADDVENTLRFRLKESQVESYYRFYKHYPVYGEFYM